MSSLSIKQASKILRLLLTREEKWQWIGIILFALGVAFLEIITASVIVVFAQVLNSPESGRGFLERLGFSGEIGDGRIIVCMAALVGGVFIFKNILAVIETFFQNFSIQKMNRNFKYKLLHRYAKIDYKFYLTRNSALGLNVVSGDVERVFTGGMIALGTVISEGFIFVALLSMIVYMNPSLALVVFLLGGVIGLVMIKVVFPKFYLWGKGFQEAAVESGQNLLQFFHAFKEIILLGKQEAFIQAFHVHSKKLSRLQALQTIANNLPRMLIEIVFVSLFMGTIIFLCAEHETPASMLGVLGGYLYTGFRLMPGLNRMIGQLSVFKGTIPSIERLYGEYNAVPDGGTYKDITDFSFGDSVAISNVDFSYANSSKKVLRGVSLDVKKGEKIGIVGETGSGKSTLVDVILGLLKPSTGRVLIDGKYAVDSVQWHEKIGYVPQSIYLTDDTIAANVAFGESEVDQERLLRAIDAAQLSRFVKQLPQQEQTMTGERGVRLSGGERQRIAIARALYRDPEVLIFDEATSALDNSTEKELMKTIESVSSGRTVIMIAHRLTTLKDCDRIIVMKDGCVDKITTYEEL